MTDADNERPPRPAPVHGAPVTASERIASLDMLRGVAILGVLVMNIYAFAMPLSAYANPLRMGGSDPYNLGVWFFTHILFDQKFISIFAMMFGAGLVLMTNRAEAKGARPAPIYYRRQFWLVIIGALHGYLIWFGDILFVYALIGMLAYLFRRRSARTLIIVACLLLPVNLLVTYGISVHMSDLKSQAEELQAAETAGETLSDEQQEIVAAWEESRVFMAPTPEDAQEDLAVYSQGYTEILAHRIPQVAMMQFAGILVYGIWRVGGLMLIGMALMKLGVLTGERSPQYYRRLLVVGYVLGLPLTIYSAVDLYAHEFDGLYIMRAGMIWNYVGSLLVALGHIGLVMLIAGSGMMRRLMRGFAAVGRMALTNYLLHSVILTTVFYGYGFGLYGELSRLWQMACVVAVIAFQLLASRWWLQRYRFGPVEWLWRSVTYWERQPMRQAA